MGVLRVAGAQLPNVVGDLEGNSRRILEAMRWAEDAAADVLVLPELALTGYPLHDLVLRREFVAATLEALATLARHAGRTTTIVGTLDRVPPRRAWDTRDRSAAIGAAVLCDGEIRGVYHKVLLPNYEVFDEARNFAAGDRPRALWRIGETVVGICICEDLWSGDGPPEAQAAAGAEILLVPNASPFHRGKPQGRHALTAAVARRNGVPVVYVNCVGAQDELVFDGGSLVVDPDGEVRFRAAQFRPERFCLDIPTGPRRSAEGPVSTVHTRVAPARPVEDAPASAPQIGQEEQIWEALVLGTRDFARKNGLDSAVVGLAGGIDSAVTAAVAADALGPDRVLGVAMPTPGSPQEELDDVKELARRLGIGCQVVAIDRVMGALGGLLSDPLDGRPTGETGEALQSRTRAAIVWAISDELGHLALATGNKSELSTGAVALHGDMAGGFAPLKDCPKTLLYALAHYRNRNGSAIPERILDPAPTAALSDQRALPPYEILDPIAERYIEKGEGLDEIVAAGFEPEVVRGILQLIDDAEFERRQSPTGVKITPRAFGQDRRMPISNAWRPFEAEETKLVQADEPAALGESERAAV